MAQQNLPGETIQPMDPGLNSGWWATRPWRQRRNYNPSHQFLVYLLLVVGAAIMIIPLLWLISSSFKDSGRIFIFPPQWIPNPWRFENYPEVFAQVPFLRVRMGIHPMCRMGTSTTPLVRCRSGSGG
jgi:hypothetical protein